MEYVKKGQTFRGGQEGGMNFPIRVQRIRVKTVDFKLYWASESHYGVKNRRGCLMGINIQSLLNWISNFQRENFGNLNSSG